MQWHNSLGVNSPFKRKDMKNWLFICGPSWFLFPVVPKSDGGGKVLGPVFQNADFIKKKGS